MIRRDLKQSALFCRNHNEHQVKTYERDECTKQDTIIDVESVGFCECKSESAQIAHIRHLTLHFNLGGRQVKSVTKFNKYNKVDISNVLSHSRKMMFSNQNYNTNFD